MKSPLRSFLIFAVQLLPFAVHAAEVATPTPVYVTATRLDDDPRRTPAHVTILTADDIRRLPAKTLPELLALEAGVNTRSLFGNNGVNATVDIRGFGATSGQNTLVLLDGRRLTDVDLAAVDFAAIPLGAIERVEITHGSGAVLYGDGAVGGTINIITRASQRSGTRASVNAGAGSYDTKSVDASVAHGGPSTINLFANAIQSDGYRHNNRLDQANVLVDARRAREDGEWYLKLGADDRKLRLPGVRRVDPAAGLDQLHDDPRGTDTPNDYANQDGYLVTAGVTRILPGDGRAVVDAGYRRKNQKAFFDDYAFGGAFARYVDTDLATWSLTPRLKLTRGLFGMPGNATTGVDYYRSYYDSDRALNPTTAATPAHRLGIDQSSAAVYGESSNDVTATTRLTLGARLQRVELNARDAYNPAAPGGAFSNQAPDLATTDTEYMFDLGVHEQLSTAASVYARIGRSARFATVDELYEADPNTFLQVFSPLRPQTSNDLNIGADYAPGDTRLSSNIYYVKLKNEIHFNPVTFTNDNLDPTRRFGLTVSASTRLAPALRGKADYGYTVAQFRGGAFAGNDVPLVPRHSGSLGMSWDVRQRSVWTTTARYTGTKRFDNDQSNTFAPIPAYTVVDTKWLETRGPWRFELAVFNLLDKKAAFDYGVRSTAPGSQVYNAYPLPERNIALSVGRDF